VDLRSVAVVAVCVPWNSNSCGNSGSLGVTTCTSQKKKTSRQLSKSCFSTQLSTNSRLLFHERVFFIFPSRLVIRTVSSPSLRSFRRKGPESREATWNSSPIRKLAAEHQAAVTEEPRSRGQLLPQDSTNPAGSGSGRSKKKKRLPSCRP
jgi:hypothetical protein